MHSVISFTYSSWQQMFAGEFSSDMTGYFVLLVDEKDYDKCNDYHHYRVNQKIDDTDQIDPYKTSITAKLSGIGLDGEMVTANLDSTPPISVVIKLPCGAKRCPWKDGVAMRMTGELQFQIKPQLETMHGTQVLLKGVKPATTDIHTDDLIAYVDSGNIKGLL